MNLTDLLLVITPLGLVLVGAGLFFFGWLLGGPRSRPFYTVVVVTALAALLSQAALGVGFARASGLRTPEASLYTWSPVGDTGFGVTLGFRADLLAYLFALPLSGLTLLAVLYLIVRRPQAEAQEGILPGRLYGLIFLAEGAGLAAFYSIDLVLLYFWLEAVGLALYLLSGPGLRGAGAKPASFRAWGINIFAGQLIFAPLLVMISRGGGRSNYTELIPAVLDPLIFGLIVAGCLAKAAQFPFQVWLGGFDDLPGAAYGLVSAGFIFPFAVYLPVRLQVLNGDRGDLLGGLGWLLVPVGSLTILFAALTALQAKQRSLTGLIGLLAAAQFGLVVLALGLNLLNAAFQQLLALSVGLPLMFLCADQLQIELAPPLNPDNRSNPKPLGRPALFRGLLVGLFLVGAWNVAGLPLSPAYNARWQTLNSLLASGNRFFFGIVGVGLVLLLVALLRVLLLFFNGTRRTVDAKGQEWFWALSAPLGLALASIGLGFQPGLTAVWVSNAVGKLSSADQANAGSPVSVGWLGLLVAGGLIIGTGLYWTGRRTVASPYTLPYNGGLVFGPEDLTKPRFARTGRSKMALKVIAPEEEIPEGFEDDFFSSAFGRKPKPVQTTRRQLAAPRLSNADYFGPLSDRVVSLSKLLDTGYSAGFFVTLLLRLTDRVRGVFEWLVERFYPALAAFILLIFIILLTR